MSNYKDLYCKMYIDTEMEEADLVEFVAKAVSGSKQLFRSVVSDILDNDVMRNDDFNSILRVQIQDGFLYSRYFLDIDPKENVHQFEYISNILNYFKFYGSKVLRRSLHVTLNWYYQVMEVLIINKAFK